MSQQQQQQKQRQQLDEIQSTNILRNLLRISVSEICYLRHLFPSDLFISSVYAGIRVKRLSPPAHDDACRILQWVEDGICEALSQKYLDAMVMEISHAVDASNVIETYVYRVDYANGSIEVNDTKCTANDAREQAVQLMRNLIKVTNALPSLPPDRLISMKLRFTRETPTNWVPKHFKRIEFETNVDEFDYSFGSISTGYHRIHVHMSKDDTADSQETCIEADHALQYLSKHSTIRATEMSQTDAEELVQSGVLRRSAQHSNIYDVAAYDPVLYQNAVYETHGHHRIAMTISDLAKALQVHEKLAETILLRMEVENLSKREGFGTTFRLLHQEEKYLRQLLQHTKRRRQVMEWGSASPIVQVNKKIRTLNF